MSRYGGPMDNLPLRTSEKIGIVIYGLAAGLGTAFAFSIGLLVLGTASSLTAQSTRWFYLGDYHPWLPLIGLEYGFFLGLIIGAFICWKVWQARFKE